MIYIIFTNKLFHYLKEKVIIMRKIFCSLWSGI